MNHFKIFLVAGCTLLFTACNNKTETPTTVADTSATEVAANGFDRTILPILPRTFAGTVDTNATQSKADFPVEVAAPAGAPNVLIILTDDVGFGAASTFGGPIAAKVPI